MYHAAAGVWMYVCVCGPDALGACYQLVVSRTGRYRTAWDDLQVGLYVVCRCIVDLLVDNYVCYCYYLEVFMVYY